MDYKYWPYEELEMKTSGGDVHLKTPWIELNLKLDPAMASQLQGIYNNIQQQIIKPEEALIFSQFIKQVDRYPIFYILPLIKYGDEHKLKDNNFVDGKIKTLVDHLCQSKEEGQQGFASKEDEQEIMMTLKSRTSPWDHDSILKFATVDEMYCPESVLTAVRKFHMIEVKERGGVSQVYTTVRELPDDQQQDMAARLIRQNHYVTSRCIEAVEPALEIAQSSKEEVEKFIKEEKGHDIIMAKAVEAAGFDAEKVEVCLNARVIMDLLKFSASRNFLAFALLIDFFERSNFSGKDPLGELLSDIGLKDSAKLVNRHMQINDMGEHDAVSLDLLKNVGLVTEPYLREALAIAELTSVFSNGIASKTLEDYLLEMA